MNIEKLVNICGSRNPINIAKFLGIIILYEPLGTINGFYNTAFRHKFIHVNENLPSCMQYFTIAHELAHAILHPNLNTQFLRDCTFFSINKYEIEANSFAVNLIISDDDLEEYKGCTIEQLSSIYGLPISIIKLRLKCSRSVQD